jgi:DNA-binding beta-propeller fold protein YncE
MRDSTAPSRRPTDRRGSRSPLRLIALFAATLGAYWPLWLHRTYSALGRGDARPTALTPRAAPLLAVVPVLNLAGIAYLAVDLPRALRRLASRDSGAPDTEVLSLLMFLPLAAGAGLAALLDLALPLGVLLSGYLAWPFELPAAIALERTLAATPAGESDVAPRQDTFFAVAVGAIALVAAGAALLTGDGDDEPPPRAAPPPAEVSDIAVTRDPLWISNTVRGTVLKLDPDTRRPLAPPIRVGRQPLDIAAGAGAVWVANYQSGTVLRIDPASNQLTGPIETGRGPFGIDVGGGRVWVSNQVERTVTAIDPASNKSAGASTTVGRGPRGLAFGDGAVWVANGESKSVSRVVPGESRARQIKLGRFPHDVAVGGGSVWVTIPEDGLVRRIDPRTATLRAGSITVPGGPSSIEAGLGRIWVAGEAGSVTALDPRSGRLAGTAVRVGGRISDLTVGRGAVWVLRADGKVRRIPGPRR